MINALKNISAFKIAHSLSDADWLDIADVNRDGQVNNGDFSFLNNLLTGSHLYLAGDFNMDGKVTAADLQAMLLAFKNTSDFEASRDLSDAAWEEIGDVNGDGRVDMADVAGADAFIDKFLRRFWIGRRCARTGELAAGGYCGTAVGGGD